MAAPHAPHPTPLGRFRDLIRVDARDLAVVLSYTFLTGLLALAVPLAAQALVNTIAVGIFLQPLVVLSVVVLLLLLFRGFLRLLKLYLVEVLQQRVFLRVSLHLAQHLPRIRQDALSNAYAPELANRFFDVLTIQKSWAKLLTEGPSAMLQSLVGLLLMGFYSPLLLAFDVVLVAAGLFVIFGLGLGGVRTSIEESAEKYRVAHWLEEVGRCERNFKFTADPDFSVREADRLVDGYLDARQGHFQVLLRQAFGSYLLQALASAGILAVGGWLVIQRQLTMGQLVASELIVISVLGALEKLIRLAEPFYDLLTALEKIGHVTDLPEEVSGPVEVPADGGVPPLRAEGVRYRYREGPEVLRGIDVDLPPGTRLGITGPSGAGKTTLLHLLSGLFPPAAGGVQLSGRSLSEYELTSLRHAVTMVGDRFDVFEGTLEQNLRVGRDDLGGDELARALELTGLVDDLRRFPEGLQTRVLSEGKNLSGGQVQRLLVARAILGRPKILAFDESLRGLDPFRRDRLVEGLVADPTWSLIFVSQDREVLRHCDRILLLEEGQVTEVHDAEDLAKAERTAAFLDGTYSMEVTA